MKTQVLGQLRAMVCLAAVLVVFGCSKDQKEKSDNAGAVSQQELDTPCNNPAGCSASDQAQAGLPGFCAITEYYGKTCLRCTPRELPLVRCADHVVPAFATNEFCQHKLDQVSCVITDDDLSLSIDVAKKGLREKYYENLPQFLGGIKLVIANTVKDQNDADRKVIFAVLDLVAKHRHALFSGTNTQAVKDEVVSMLAAKNKLDAAGLENLTSYVNGAVDYFSMGVDRDVVTSQDIVAMVKNMFSMFSAEGVDLLSSKMDFEKIEASLTSVESLEMIEEMLKGLAEQ